MSTVNSESKSIVDETVLYAFEQLGGTSYVPSIIELREFAKLHPDLNVRVITVRDNEEYVGLSICFVNHDRVHGFKLKTYRVFGYTLFDYNTILFKNGYFHHLKQAIEFDAKGFGCDIVILDNLINEIVELRDSVYHLKEIIKLCDLNKQEFLMEKQSFIRARKKILNQGKYRVVNKFSDFTKEDIELLADLHIERWNFENIESQFKKNKKRVLEYLSYKENKLLTIIYLDDQIVAAHYGMVYGTRLIFHTPVINIKFLDNSPLKILLFELNVFCKENGINTLDLGLGQESYKDGIYNDHQLIHNYKLPITLKAFLCILLGRYFNPQKVKSASQTLINVARSLRRNFASIFCNINYYRHHANAESKMGTYKRITHNKLVVINLYQDFVDFMRYHKAPIKKYHYSRFKANSNFVALVNDAEKIVTTAWLDHSAIFHITEIRKNIGNKNTIMIYDVFTGNEYRNNGYFKEMLWRLTERFQDKNLAIFASNKNKPSNSAINTAGFIKSSFEIIKS